MQRLLISPPSRDTVFIRSETMEGNSINDLTGVLDKIGDFFMGSEANSSSSGAHNVTGPRGTPAAKRNRANKENCTPTKKLDFDEKPAAAQNGQLCQEQKVWLGESLQKSLSIF